MVLISEMAITILPRAPCVFLFAEQQCNKWSSTFSTGDS